MNHSLQKAGGIAALVEALAYVVGFAVLLTVLNPGSADLDAASKLAFFLDRLAWVQAWNLFIYVVFGVVLVVLALALHERLKAEAPALMQVVAARRRMW